MDRREALKKLAAGGAVAVGVPAIVSSVAFAAVNPTPPSVTVTTGNLSRRAEVTMRQDLGTCANSGSPSITASGYTLTGSANVNVPGQSSGTLSPGVARARNVLAARPLQAPFADGDTLTVVITTTFACLASTRTCRYTYVFTYTGSAFPASVTPTVSCS